MNVPIAYVLHLLDQVVRGADARTVELCAAGAPHDSQVLIAQGARRARRYLKTSLAAYAPDATTCRWARDAEDEMWVTGCETISWVHRTEPPSWSVCPYCGREIAS